MDRYRVLADSSDLRTSNITPFGAIDDEMHGGIRDILVEVAELGGYQLSHSVQAESLHLQMLH